jgi:hypothetical protein
VICVKHLESLDRTFHPSKIPFQNWFLINHYYWIGVFCCRSYQISFAWCFFCKDRPFIIHVNICLHESPNTIDHPLMYRPPQQREYFFLGYHGCCLNVKASNCSISLVFVYDLWH